MFYVSESERLKFLWSVTLRILLMCLFFWIAAPDVNLLTRVTQEDSGLYSVHSTLEYRVTEEDKDAHFSCEASFLVPGAVRRAESSPVNVSVHCEWSLSVTLHQLVFVGVLICLSQRPRLTFAVCERMCAGWGARERIELH